MANVRRIESLKDIPRDRKYVVVTSGDESGLSRDGESFVVTADRSLPPNEFESHLEVMISDAELIAERERIDTVYVCVASPRTA